MKRCLRLACVAIAVVCATVSSLHAEVAAQVDGPRVGILILGIIEDPDPIPQIIWTPYRDVDPALQLNGDGAERGDGLPSIDWLPSSNSPAVIWAYDGPKARVTSISATRNGAVGAGRRSSSSPRPPTTSWTRRSSSRTATRSMSPTGSAAVRPAFIS